MEYAGAFAPETVSVVWFVDTSKGKRVGVTTRNGGFTHHAGAANIKLNLTYRHLGVPALLLALFAIAAVGCGKGPSEITVSILEQESSGQSGTATLTEKGPQTEIVLQVSLGPAEDDPQPVHIHFGSCGANLGEVHFPLVDLVAGKSTTLVAATITELADGSHNVNLHKSSLEIRIYTSCGNIEPE